MSDDDARLAAFFAASEPPARDLAFSAGVMEAVARARFRREMARLALFSLVGGVVLWAVWPSLAPVLVQVGGGLAPAGAALVVAAAVLLLADGRAMSALGLRS
ncbi:MAG: hypothetical protein Q8Q88_16585 [Phenylobacterium sp.]|uniref:hypothetical protein n=1 Tax=Phenylobacterium sp. TaxID=1871053 RepID=UPI002736AB62|nr:hypothetical protein [Phenylobacterium sp.]MDP3748657.1 hypothetical protein [Phenylobacterium sp.]